MRAVLRLPVILSATPLFATALCTATVHAQVDQRALTQQLVGESRAERAQALATAEVLGPASTGPELRRALMSALEQESRLQVERDRAARRGEILQELEDPELIGTAARVVAELRDPNAIPALASALGSGFAVIRALVEFGEQAAPAVLAAVMSPQSMHDAINHGLITLRFMVEGAETHPLSPATLAQIRSAAEQHLRTGKVLAITTLWWAIDLASVLKDARLRRTLESLSINSNEIVARGVEDPELIERTQQRAAERLAGIPPLPRP